MRRHLRRLDGPDAGRLPGEELTPVPDLPRLDDLPEPDAQRSRSLLDRPSRVSIR
ncbi:MAG: hypothetical protein L0I24_22435 [Pseudonocardia sp.]|nr:hypothetical protein [Pseudonocardia sp.]